MSLAVLPNFPFKDQLSEATTDGYPPENARFDCVATSFAAAIQYYDGGYVSGDELKDAEYGQSYKDAGTALRRYVDDATDLARSKYHVTAVPYSNTNTIWLVGRIHTWLKQGYPVIATIPSQWGNSYPMATLAHPPFSTHVIVFYGEIDGGLEAMNPWKSYHHSGSDAYWQGRLCEGQIWAVVKEADVTQANPNPTPLELSQWHELQADRAQIATLKQQLAAVQAQSVKQYQEILANRAQILRQNATIASLQQQLQNVPPPDPVAADLLAAVRRAAKSA